MSKARPTAVERTVSMFTGMTDLDGPNARDGSLEEERRKRWRKALPGSGWKEVHGMMGRWLGPAGRMVQWDRKTEEFVLTEPRQKEVRFRTLTDAIAAAK